MLGVKFKKETMRTLYLFAIALLSFIPLFSYSSVAKVESDSLVFICNELLGRPTSNSITIHASANKSLDVYYEYGIDSSAYSNQTSMKSSQDSVPFIFIIDNLKPNTQYFYRMRFRETGTTEYICRSSYKFVTQRKSGETFKFAIEADPHLDTNSNPASYALTLQNILAANPDFLLDLGDTFMSEKLPQKKTN